MSIVSSSAEAEARFALEKESESREMVDVLGRILAGDVVVSFAASFALVLILILGARILICCGPGCEDATDALLFVVVLPLGLLDRGESGSRRGEGSGERDGEVSEAGDVSIL